MAEKLYLRLIYFLADLGKGVAEMGEPIIDWLMSTSTIPGFEGVANWEMFVGAFITLVIPYTLIKWAIPL